MSEYLCVNCGLPITTNACRWRGDKKVKHEPVEDCFPLVRAELARLRDELRKAERAIELHAAIENAAENLPEWWEINISIEQDSSYVTVWFDGDKEDFATNYESLAEQISSAVRHAVKQEAKHEQDV